MRPLTEANRAAGGGTYEDRLRLGEMVAQRGAGPRGRATRAIVEEALAPAAERRCAARSGAAAGPQPVVPGGRATAPTLPLRRPAGQPAPGDHPAAPALEASRARTAARCRPYELRRSDPDGPAQRAAAAPARARQGRRLGAAQVVEEAERQYYDPAADPARTHRPGERLEDGQIDEAEFDRREDELLDRLGRRRRDRAQRDPVTTDDGSRRRGGPGPYGRRPVRPATPPVAAARTSPTSWNGCSTRAWSSRATSGSTCSTSNCSRSSCGCIVASVDKAKEMGIDWWEHDPRCRSRARRDELPGERRAARAHGRAGDRRDRATGRRTRPERPRRRRDGGDRATLGTSYAVVRADTAHAALERVTRGRGRTGPRAVRHGGLAVVASPVPAADFAEGPLRARLEDLTGWSGTARAHQQVVDALAGRRCRCRCGWPPSAAATSGVRRLLAPAGSGSRRPWTGWRAGWSGA